MEKTDQEGEEGNGRGKPHKVPFDEEDNNEALIVSRAGSLVSSSSSTGTTDSDAGGPFSVHGPMPRDHEVEILAPPRTTARIPRISPPPPLVLERPAGYDPNRIPSSIFASRPSNPAEWSVASNESLFSIHMGNSSFSRDHTSFLLYKSGELTKLDEVFSVPTPLPPVSESLSLQRDSVSSSVAANSLRLPNPKDDPVDLGKCEPSNEGNSLTLDKASEDEQHKGNSSPPGDTGTSVSLSARSDGSATTASTGSFAFPILAGSKSSSVKTSDGRMEPSKEVPPPPPPQTTPQPQQQNHRTRARAALSNCFSCFSRCSFRCSFSLK